MSYQKGEPVVNQNARQCRFSIDAAGRRSLRFSPSAGCGFEEPVEFGANPRQVHGAVDPRQAEAGSRGGVFFVVERRERYRAVAPLNRGHRAVRVEDDRVPVPWARAVSSEAAVVFGRIVEDLEPPVAVVVIEELPEMLRGPVGRDPLAGAEIVEPRAGQLGEYVRRQAAGQVLPMPLGGVLLEGEGQRVVESSVEVDVVVNGAAGGDDVLETVAIAVEDGVGDRDARRCVGADGWNRRTSSSAASAAPSAFSSVTS